MFTGLVENTARVVRWENRGEQARLWVQLPFHQELALGDSVAVNGCCLTVAEFSPEATAFDLLTQTLQITALRDLQPDFIVNVERALQAQSRLGGHLVQGHIDTTAELISLTPHGQDHRLEIALPPSIRSLCVDKGSLTVDGISLTIADLRAESAVFWITPHTFTNTHLPHKQAGQRVNLEADYFTKIISQTFHQLAPSLLASLASSQAPRA